MKDLRNKSIHVSPSIISTGTAIDFSASALKLSNYLEDLTSDKIGFSEHVEVAIGENESAKITIPKTVQQALLMIMVRLCEYNLHDKQC